MRARFPRAGVGAVLLLLPMLAIIAAAVVSCSGARTDLRIRFDIEDGAAAGNPTVRALQFYVHDIELLDEGGKAHPFTLDAVVPWQTERVALVSLADATAQPHVTVSGTARAAAASYAGVRFTLGVPFELNHANPLSAAAPLDRSELFWTWQSGYKFLRVDLAADGREWSFHLGSTGCSSASALRPPAAPCAQPNRMQIELKGDPLRKPIRLRLDTLMQAARAASYSACTGNYAHDPGCRAVYASTGLQFEGGVCPGGQCAAQRLWTLD